MNIKNIKTELFTRTTITTYGVKFEYFDKKSHEKNPINPINYMIIIHLQKDGSIKINHILNNSLNYEQLHEIARVSKILRGENEN